MGDSLLKEPPVRVLILSLHKVGSSANLRLGHSELRANETFECIIHHRQSNLDFSFHQNNAAFFFLSVKHRRAGKISASPGMKNMVHKRR